MLKFSLIIPVYNEERHIKACLDAVAKQTQMPDEVIVVDNNSTDRTVEIAKQYPFVRVVSETFQGRGHARSAGFNAAKGDILGRIDADSRVAPDWSECMRAVFEADVSIDGVTGFGRTSILPITNYVKGSLFSRAYYWYINHVYKTVTMWGANMAVRSSAWNRVKGKVILDDRQVHEDIDLSLWIAAAGGKIIVSPEPWVTVDGQSYRYAPKAYYYGQLIGNTHNIHKKNGNLNSPRLRRLTRLQVLPGLIAALMVGTPMALVSVLLFPLDVLMVKVFKLPSWLD